MIRRFAILLLALLLIPVPTAGQEKRPIFPIENYLPGTTTLLVEAPDGKTAMDIVARLGDSREGLAGRIAGSTGVKAPLALTRLNELVALADGPATLSRHRIRVPGRPQDGESTLVTLTSAAGRDEALKQAAIAFLKDVVMAGPDSKVTGERLMDLTVLHFTRGNTELYLAMTQGYLLVASSPFLMGLVLRELQGPSVKTLRYRASFEEAQKLREAQKLQEASGPRAAIFWCAKEALPKFLGPLGIKRISGVLVPQGNGFRDEMRVEPENYSLLPRLATTGTVPDTWSDAAADGIWVGAAMTPRGVLSLAIAILDPDHVMQAIRIDEVATGSAEFLWRPGRAPAMAMTVTKGADVMKVTRPLGDLAAKRSDGAVAISEELGAWPAQLTVEPAAGAAKGEGRGGARLAARVATLLGLFGRTDVPGKAKTALAIRRDGKFVTVSASRGEVGPIQLVIGAILP